MERETNSSQLRPSLLSLWIAISISAPAALADTAAQQRWSSICKNRGMPSFCECVKNTLTTEDLAYFTRAFEITTSNASPAVKNYEGQAAVEQWTGGNLFSAMAKQQAMQAVLRDQCGIGTKTSTEIARLQIQNLTAAVELFKLDTGRYPSTEEGLGALVERPKGTNGWNGPYIRKRSALTDPWGNPYHYLCPGAHGDFDLFSYGSDTAQGANGKMPQIGNWLKTR